MSTSTTNFTARPYWADVESRLDDPGLRELQWEKLQHRLREAYDVSPYWRRRLDEAGARPERITSWKAFAELVPPYVKADYRELADSCDNSMPEILRQLLGSAAGEMVTIATTSGTTGAPTPYPLTPRDLHLWGEVARRAVWRAGVRPGDMVLQGFGLSMFLAGVPVVMAMAEMGVSAIPVGAEAGTDAILKFARLFRPQAMFCTPSLADYLIETAGDRDVDLAALGIRKIFAGGEPGAGIPQVRKRIEDAFGATLYDFAGALGASCGTAEYRGMHWLVDDLAVMELVDPVTHELVPFEDGAEGLGVYTPLEAPGLLGIRQSNGDLLRVHTGPCSCGRTGWRYEFIGRDDDMLKVKGVMVYPLAIDNVVQSFVPELTGQFRIVLDEPPPRVTPPLRLTVEHGDGVQDEQLAALESRLLEEIHRALKLRPKIEWVEPNSLPRSTKKTDLFDRRYAR